MHEICAQAELVYAWLDSASEVGSQLLSSVPAVIEGFKQAEEELGKPDTRLFKDTNGQLPLFCLIDREQWSSLGGIFHRS